MSISQPSLYATPPDVTALNLDPKPRQSLQERLLNKKSRIKVRNGHQAREELEQYTPFFVPDRLLRDDNRRHMQSQSPLLNNLPPELLLLIVEHLSIPYFQVSLGLTCKTVAAILSQNRMRMSSWRGWWDKEGLYRLLNQPERPLSSSSSTSFLKQRTLSTTEDHSEKPPPLPPSSPSTPYIRTTHRLCRACFRHVPRDPIYWQRKMLSTDYDAPSVNWFDITNFFEEGYRNCGQHKCPDCCVKGYTAFMSKEAYERALREDEREGLDGCSVGLEDEKGRDRGRRVCPGLRRRMERP